MNLHGNNNHMNNLLNKLAKGETPARSLTSLVNEGYTSMGLHYSCGCFWSGWYKEGKLVYEHREQCFEHKQSGKGPTSDSHDGTSEILQIDTEPEVIEGTLSTNSLQG